MQWFPRSFAIASMLKPIDSTYQQTLEVLYNKPSYYPNCPVIQRYHLLSMESFKQHMSYTFQILHGMTLPPVSHFVKLVDSTTRKIKSVASSDCIKPFRCSKIGQPAFLLRILLKSTQIHSHKCSDVFMD